MKLMEEEKRAKLMELEEVACIINPVMRVYVKVDITPELTEKINTIMDGIQVVIIKKE